MNKIKVLYIAGLGRSGTTIVDRLLGEVDNFVSVGELRHIWSRSYQENQLCGCSNKFHDCTTWNNITRNAFPDGLNEKKLKRVIFLQQKLNRIRSLQLLKNKNHKADTIDYINNYLRPLYEAIQKEFPGHVIVDSSKIPAYLYILKQCEFIELSVLHVVRDPRAVAFSWLKKKIRPEITDKNTYMPTISPLRISIMWIVFNSLIKKISNSLSTKNYMALSYERFTEEPKDTIQNISIFMDNKADISIFKNANSATLKINHSVSGNPMRFKTGLITIKDDDQWIKSMRTKDRMLVSVLTSIFKRAFKTK